MKVWMKILIIVPALWVAGMVAYAQSQSSSQQSGSDPVADAARKAREDKKNAAKPKKVYTDDDVKPATAAAATAATPAPSDASGAAATGTAGQPKPDEAAPKEDPNGEKAWRKRFKDQRDKLAKIKAKQQEIAQLKQGLEDMEAELRKSGGDPGWAR